MIDFRDVITEQVLADYLTAEFGHDLAIWDDGSYEIIESSMNSIVTNFVEFAPSSDLTRR